MQKSQRLSKSESARERRSKVREIVELKISNLYSRLHKLRLKKQKLILHKKKYLFIPDDIIELQMFQGCQNWSWISQGVLDSNFIALPGIPGGRAIQL